jgi:hypothetical protein
MRRFRSQVADWLLVTAVLGGLILVAILEGIAGEKSAL